MTPHLLYQRWLELDPPESCAHIPPIASWVLPLPNASALVTLLYRPLTSPSSPPRTKILLLSPTGDSQPWAPSTAYPAPIMFYAQDNAIYGLDLTLPGKVYACDLEGRHIGTLTMDLRMNSILAPQCMTEINGRLHWVNKSGQHRSARINGHLKSGLDDERPEIAPPPQTAEIHFPHTHLCADSCLYILDHDPMSRITKFQLV